MFLRKITQYYSSVPQKWTAVRSFLNSRAAPTQEIFDKWKSRFQDEKVPEINASLSNILGHIIGERKVNIDLYL